MSLDTPPCVFDGQCVLDRCPIHEECAERAQERSGEERLTCQGTEDERPYCSGAACHRFEECKRYGFLLSP